MTLAVQIAGVRTCVGCTHARGGDPLMTAPSVRPRPAPLMGALASTFDTHYAQDLIAGG